MIARNHVSRAIKVYMIVESVPRAPLCIGMAPLQIVLPVQELDGGKDMSQYAFDEYTIVKHVMFDLTGRTRKPWHSTVRRAAD